MIQTAFWLGQRFSKSVPRNPRSTQRNPGADSPGCSKCESCFLPILDPPPSLSDMLLLSGFCERNVTWKTVFKVGGGKKNKKAEEDLETHFLMLSS